MSKPTSRVIDDSVEHLIVSQVHMPIIWTRNDDFYRSHAAERTAQLTKGQTMSRQRSSTCVLAVVTDPMATRNV